MLKIAETREELEACFRVLHDAYVDSGYMLPDPSGMRVTIYHALPTTTTLCAKYDGRVVGTVSLIRESAFGFPLQRIFDLTAIREQGGNIAEASALAIHRGFRRTGGSILFPLIKFMYEYCTTFFDTRHMVIAVNPSHISMYESLLFFRRLTAKRVENYDFVNGAPAIGATLDFKFAPEIFRQHYDGKAKKNNLYRYFLEKLPNIQLPSRRFYTTNDPVMTPELLDYFFNVRTPVFAQLSDRKKSLLHAIYDLDDYRKVLPAVSKQSDGDHVRRHRRFSVRCPAYLHQFDEHGDLEKVDLEVTEVSRYGFLARTAKPLRTDTWCDAVISLGMKEVSRMQVIALHSVSCSETSTYGFELGEPDLVWRKFVAALYEGHTHSDLQDATRFFTG